MDRRRAQDRWNEHGFFLLVLVVFTIVILDRLS